MTDAPSVKPGARERLSLLAQRLRGTSDVSPFKKAFYEGLLAGAVVFLLLAGWMALRAGDTAERLQGYFPLKTTLIEEAEKSAGQSADPDTPQQSALGDSKNIHALPPAPIDGLYETVEGKQLPKARITDDMTPFQAYKKPFTPVAGRPLVSIVIVDFGLSDMLSQSILDNMPPEISLVMSPYTSSPAKWGAAARAYGHEFWLSLPMQTSNADDSGPEALMMNMPIEETQKRVISVLGTAAGYAGLVSKQNHVFTTQNDLSVGTVMKQVTGRGLAFVESNPDIAAYGLSIAMESGSPYAQNNFWLDNDLRPETIARAFQALELQASRKGKAIAFVHPYPVVIKKLQEWIASAEENGYQLAPLSAMVQ